MSASLQARIRRTADLAVDLAARLPAAIKAALLCMASYLLALLVTLLVCGAWLLDGPNEVDTARLVELVVVDLAVAEAALKDRP